MDQRLTRSLAHDSDLTILFCSILVNSNSHLILSFTWLYAYIMCETAILNVGTKKTKNLHVYN